MRFLLPLIVCLAVPFAMSKPASAAPLEDFAKGPNGQWSFFTDRVMGGVSSGSAKLTSNALLLEGAVSTANNGGFIQVRRRVDLPADATAIRLRVRGNGQRYYLHLRTGGTPLPWQYYQAGFDAPRGWTDVTIPLSDFVPSGRVMRSAVRPGSVRTLAVVAYGRDHDARIEVAEISVQ
ncbi:MAG: CIA30 family protein [Paracoccaceae bacterium]